MSLKFALSSGAAVLLLAGWNSQGQTPRTTEPPNLPVLLHAAQFNYPPIARAAHQTGDIELDVSTDGQRPTGFSAVKGSAMLQAQTEAEILTWQFELHTPTIFHVVVHYRLLNGEPCADPTAAVRLAGPYEYEVTAHTGGCDRARYLRGQQALVDQHAYAVGLHLTRDQRPAKLPSEVTLSDGKQSISIAVKDGVFLVPETYRTAAQLEFRARMGAEQVDISGISPSTLDEDWNIELADKSFGKGGDQWFRQRAGIRKGCILSFDPVDGDGAAMMVSNCRDRIK
jgi:hypothetical protein